MSRKFFITYRADTTGDVVVSLSRTGEESYEISCLSARPSLESRHARDPLSTGPMTPSTQLR